MIHIEIYTHDQASYLFGKNSVVHFEKNDIAITRIGEGEFIKKEDFDKLWKAILEINTKDFVVECWYSLSFRRITEVDEFTNKTNYWFEFVESVNNNELTEPPKGNSGIVYL